LSLQSASCTVSPRRGIPQLLHHQARHRVELVVGKFDLKYSLNSSMGVWRTTYWRSSRPADVHILVDVVLVVDVADDLLDHVFDGDQAGNPAAFVGDDGHVNPRAPNSRNSTLEAWIRARTPGPHELLDEVRVIILRGQRNKSWRAGCRRSFRGLIHHGKREWRSRPPSEQQFDVTAIEHRHLCARHHDVAHLDVTVSTPWSIGRTSPTTPAGGFAQVFDHLAASAHHRTCDATTAQPRPLALASFP
jgi:hypothetical protein